MAQPYHFHRGQTIYLQFLRYSKDYKRVFLCPVCKRKELAS